MLRQDLAVLARVIMVDWRETIPSVCLQLSDHVPEIPCFCTSGSKQSKLRRLFVTLLTEIIATAASHDMQGMGCFETYCVICGGPSSQAVIIESEEMLAALGKEDGEFDWLDEHIGIPEDNVPVAIGGYRLYGAFQLPGNLYTATVYDYKQKDMTDGDSYGLSCHEACYAFLHARLD